MTTGVSEIGRIIGRNRSTVYSFLKKVKDKGFIHNIKNKGRPKLFSKRTIKRIMTYVKNTKQTTIAEIKSNLNLPGSKQTITKVLHQHKFKYLKKIKKPRISTQNIQKRYEFACKHQRISVRKLKSLVFSDECSFELSKYQDKRSWRKIGTSFDIRNIHQVNPIYSKRYIKFWCFITFNGKSKLIFVNKYGKWCCKSYLKLLEENFSSEITNLGLNIENVIHIEDNDTVHTGEKIKRWKRQNKLKTFDWPPQSPDLNPIENAFSILKKICIRLNHITKLMRLKMK